MGTKNEPSSFDCYANAEPDEPMFILLARDESAPDVVVEWVKRRRLRKGYEQTGRRGYYAPLDRKDREALACAHAMKEWRAGWTPPGTPER